MLINSLNLISEFFLWVLVFGITFSNAAVEVAVSFLILLFFIRRFISKEIDPPKTPINTVIYFLLIITFISFLRSGYFQDSLKGALRIIKYTLLYFSLMDLLSGERKRLNRLFWVMICVAGFTFLNGIFQDIFGFDILRHHQVDKLDYLHRINSSFIHPNDFGAYIISILPLSLIIFSPGISKRKKIILSIICLLGFYCLIRTSSRGAWLGFLIGVSIFFLYYKKRLFILIPIIIILFFIVSPHGLTRISGIFDLGKDTAWERLQLWKGAWNMIKEHPLLGFGINTFSDYFPKYKPADYFSLRYAHNSYLQMWSEIGLVGLVTFLILIFIVFKTALRKIKDKIKKGLYGFIVLSLISGYAGFLVQSALDTNLHSLVLVTQFWLITAYMISLDKLLKDKKE